MIIVALPETGCKGVWIALFGSFPNGGKAVALQLLQRYGTTVRAGSPGALELKSENPAIPIPDRRRCVSMIVPSVTQLINGSGGDRCGEACLSACLDALGLTTPPTMHQIADYLRKPFNAATTLPGDLINAAHNWGASAQLLNSEMDTRQALKNGWATIMLIYNGLLDPLPYPHAPGWIANHWVVLEDEPGPRGMVSLMDPLAYPPAPQADQHVLVSWTSFLNAIHHVPLPTWGVALYTAPPVKKALKVGPK